MQVFVFIKQMYNLLRKSKSLCVLPFTYIMGSVSKRMSCRNQNDLFQD